MKALLIAALRLLAGAGAMLLYTRRNAHQQEARRYERLASADAAEALPKRPPAFARPLAAQARCRHGHDLVRPTGRR